MIVNSEQLCEIFGFSNKTLYNYKNQGMPVSGKDGKSVLYDTVKIHEWLENRTLSQAESTDFATERTRKTKIEADLAELEFRKKSGELIETESVITEWSESIIKCKTKLIAIAEKTASALLTFSNQNDAKEYLLNEIYQALEELSNDYGTITNQDESVDEMEASTEINDQ